MTRKPFGSEPLILYAPPHRLGWRDYTIAVPDKWMLEQGAARWRWSLAWLLVKFAWMLVRGKVR